MMECKECGKTFKPINGLQKFCKECVKNGVYARKKPQIVVSNEKVYNLIKDINYAKGYNDGIHWAIEQLGGAK